MSDRHHMIYTSKGVEFEVLHRPQSIPLIQKLVRKVKPQLIVELGTAGAGLTAVFRDAAPTAYIRSFGLCKTPALSDAQFAVFDGRTAFIQADILRQPDIIINYLQWKNRKVLYCDGGDKTTEVKLFARILAKGDVIGVHDWTYHFDPFNATAQIITPYLERLGFKPLDHKIFEDADSHARFWIREELLGEKLGG